MLSLLIPVFFFVLAHRGVCVPNASLVCNTYIQTAGEDFTTNCSHMGLTYLPSGTNLSTTVLDLSHNYLTHVPPGLVDLKNLAELYLHDNLIEEVNTLSGLLGGLTTLTLHDNPVDCNCDLRSFLVSLHELETEILQDLSTCSKPVVLREWRDMHK
ncbi:leucine-rich repeat and death domain-containing protein 1-like [Corticium candelabrum]|uniref:leucine-rich repeat and death domain-containing protein 1-like n=1 Tax=Corticium candelabrum TaxID=121492 RepID=UPI002E2F8AAB|nr:leucine-rich repeat and death domain-containing protein 1-like [Corticium candelabrum]